MSPELRAAFAAPNSTAHADHLVENVPTGTGELIVRSL